MDEITKTMLMKLDLGGKREETFKLVVTLILSEHISDGEKIALCAHFLFSQAFKYENGKWYQRDYTQSRLQWFEDPDGIQLNRLCANWLVNELIGVLKQINNIALQLEDEKKDECLHVAGKIVDLTYLLRGRDHGVSFRKELLSICEGLFTDSFRKELFSIND